MKPPPSDFTIQDGTVFVRNADGVTVKLSFELVHRLAIEVERWKRMRKESRKECGRELREFDPHRVETSRLEVGTYERAM